MKRYQIGGLGEWSMAQSREGEYVKYEDAEKMIKFVEQLAAFDQKPMYFDRALLDEWIGQAGIICKELRDGDNHENEQV